MKSVSVQVQTDHLERLASAKSPIAAISELVWNSLDADANEVNVIIDRNALSGIEAIRVADDGNGLPYSNAEIAFKNLGGSRKSQDNRTSTGRRFHGKFGKGRFKAFSLGNHVKWITRFSSNGTIKEYSIIGDRTNIQTFKLSEPQSSSLRSTGTEVQITSLLKDFTSLSSERAEQVLTEEFALYIRQYPMVKIIFDGIPIDPSIIEDHIQDYALDSFVMEDGTNVEATLTVIEWKRQTERAIHLCDSSGISLHTIAPGIKAPGFNFTAYLKSDFIKDLDNSGNLILEDFQPGLKRLIEDTKQKLKEHFRYRSSLKAGNLVQQWKKDEIYPFEGEPKSSIEIVERQVFDVLALNVHEYLPEFEGSDNKGKRLTFNLIKEALESNPTSLRRIIQDVLELPFEKQEELAKLLERTTLEAIINASKTVSERLNFLAGLEILVFDPQSKQKLLERSQLHKIISEETWIFGEEFHLSLSDQSLTNVLKKHLGNEEKHFDTDEPVLREDGSIGIVDLMLSRIIPQAKPEKREHLIVELKRPKVKIDQTARNQIESYAIAISSDERFFGTDTTWSFWVISNELDEIVKKLVNQRDRKPGIIYEDSDGTVKVWGKTWGQLIQECKARLNFFQEKLNFHADNESAMKYLRDTHEKYLPGVLKDQQ